MIEDEIFRKVIITMCVTDTILYRQVPLYHQPIKMSTNGILRKTTAMTS